MKLKWLFILIVLKSTSTYSAAIEPTALLQLQDRPLRVTPITSIDSNKAPFLILPQKKDAKTLTIENRRWGIICLSSISPKCVQNNTKDDMSRVLENDLSSYGQGSTFTRYEEAVITEILSLSSDGFRIQITRQPKGSMPIPVGVFWVSYEFQHLSNGPNGRVNRIEFAQANQTAQYNPAANEPIIRGIVKIEGADTESKEVASGFFVSTDGLLLTNNHVVKGTKCSANLNCQLKLKFSDGSDLLVTATVYFLDSKEDVALLKVTPPEGTLFSPLKIATDAIGPEVYSIGFPAESDSPIKSNGYITGFSSTFLATSVFSRPGMSGSPVFDKSTDRVIGFISESFYREGENEGPTFLPFLWWIDKEFHISDYISGRKQTEISDTIKNIRTETDCTRMDKLLNQLQKHKSLYGMNELKAIMIQHENPLCRKIIFDFLKSKDIIKIQPGTKS